jgi:hypothetical protein
MSGIKRYLGCLCGFSILRILSFLVGTHRRGVRIGVHGSRADGSSNRPACPCPSPSTPDLLPGVFSRALIEEC